MLNDILNIGKFSKWKGLSPNTLKINIETNNAYETKLKSIEEIKIKSLVTIINKIGATQELTKRRYITVIVFLQKKFCLFSKKSK